MAKGKVLIIGLDAGTLDLVVPWAEQGYLPNMARLIREGAYGDLWSTTPAVSPPAWMSMITGKNPGKHGIYDFVQRQPGSYHLNYARPNLAAMGTMFGHLSRAGRRVCVIGVPLTYPPEVLNGIMISGPWAAESEECVTPPELYPYLKSRGYEINNTVAYTPETAEEFWDYLQRTTDVRASVALDILRREPWDLFMVVFRDTDTVASFYWHDMDPTHPQHDPARAQRFANVIRDHYRQLDQVIGQMLAHIDANTHVMIVSDHGSGALTEEISINKWLMEQGLLKLKTHTSFRTGFRDVLRKLGVTRSGLIARLGWSAVSRIKRLLPGWAEQLIPWPYAQLIEKVDWSRTQAYSYGSVGQIYVNLKGREPQGIVEPGPAYETLLDQIVTGLRSLTLPRTGQPLQVEAFRGDALYHGPYAALGPDLNLVFNDMSCTTHVTVEAIRSELFSIPADNETGFHRRNGMVMLWGPHARQGFRNDASRIIDVAPTVLHLMGEAIPENIDGQVRAELLDEDFVNEHPVERVAAAESEGGSSHSDWTPEDREKITRHLRDLGYLE